MRCFIIFIILLCASQTADADSIVLKNGDEIYCDKITEKGNIYVVEMYGGMMEFNKDEVTSISREDKPEPTLELKPQVETGPPMKHAIKRTKEEQKEADKESTVRFKSICKALQVSSEGVSGKFRELIEFNPDNIWADDSKYIVAALTPDPDEEGQELEELLEDYPDFMIEDWTIEQRFFFIPIEPELAAYMTLCLYYIETEQKQKLKGLCEQSMRRFPSKADFFKLLISEH